MATSLYAASTAAANNDCQYCSDLLKGLSEMKAKCQKCRPGNFKNCDDCDPMWLSYRFLDSNHFCTKKTNGGRGRRTVAPTGPEYDGVKPTAHMQQVVKLLQETFPEKTKDVIVAIWEQCNWNEAKAFEALFELSKHGKKRPGLPNLAHGGHAKNHPTNDVKIKAGDPPVFVPNWVKSLPIELAKSTLALADEKINDGGDAKNHPPTNAEKIKIGPMSIKDMIAHPDLQKFEREGL